MGTVNYSNPGLDSTVKIYDEFYNFETIVNAQEYDIVYSYFLTQFGTALAAGNFTVTLFRVAQTSNIPIITLLQQLEGQGQPELTLTLAYYLNSIRSPSTLLGLNTPVTPNFYTARNVRA